MVVLCSLLAFLSCKNDSHQVATTPVENSKAEIEQVPSAGKATGSDFYQPQIAVATSTVSENIPKKEDWRLINTYTVNGANLSGIAAISDSIILVSDTLNSKVIKVNVDTKKHTVILEDIKTVYLMLKKSRLLMPVFDRDSVFVYRGIPQLFKFQLPYELDRPTSIDAFRIDDFVIVDRGNNRLVNNKKGEMSLIGTKGSEPLQFNHPSCIITIGNSLYVTDTGNKRIQNIGLNREFIRSFGEGKLSQPGGVTTDGNLLFVCDEGLDEILVYNQAGNLLYSLNEDLIDPRDLFFLNGRLLVSDKDGAVKIFENKIYRSN